MAFIDTVDVNTPTTEYNNMALQWHLPVTLMDGQAAMKAARTVYLPQEPAESDALYQIRLDRSCLYNVFKHAVKKLTGRVFSKPISLSDDTDSKIVEYNDNIDMLGSDINTFWRNVFEDALIKGLSYVLVDYPITPEDISLEDELNNDIRPYCIHIKAEQVIRIVPMYVGGRVELGRVHIREIVSEPNGKWGTVEVEQIRVLYPGKWEIWRLGEKDVWGLHSEGETSLAYIPLSIFYADKTGFGTAQSPLLELADLNLSHWHSDSDQRNILHVARVPILFGTGLDPDSVNDMEIGANRLVIGPDGSELSFVEHTGGAIGSGDTDLKNLEQRMAVLSMDPSLSTGTATGDALDSNKANSSLQDMALRLQDTIDMVNLIMADWANISDSGKAYVSKDFGLMKRDGSESGILLKTRQNGSLSNETLLKEYKKRGLLSDDFDLDAELKLLEEEEDEKQEGFVNEDGERVVGKGKELDEDFGQQKIE